MNTERSERRAVARPRSEQPEDVFRVFGDVLPETTSDERDADQGAADRDTWYRENRPPHHDRP